MLDPLAVKIVSLSFGLLFLLAAIHKLSGLQRFRAILAAYEIIPPSLTTWAAVALPVLEATLGVAWLLGYRPSMLAVLSASLLAAYTLGIAVNLGRGRVHIDCGCSMGGHAGHDQQLSWGLVGRNVILMLGCMLATLPQSDRALGSLDYLTLVAGLVSIAFLYGAANQLLSNGAAIGAWRHRRD